MATKISHAIIIWEIFLKKNFCGAFPYFLSGISGSWKRFKTHAWESAVSRIMIRQLKVCTHLQEDSLAKANFDADRQQKEQNSCLPLWLFSWTWTRSANSHKLKLNTPHMCTGQGFEETP